MESEFFGYRKGAFTGADSDREGYFQSAQGGTLFLDEVADLPLGMQVKLLRVIQEKRVRRVGGMSEEPVDVRIISASHQDLQAAVAAGRFRHDLFYRLNVIEIRMPSLRELRDDLPGLAGHILARLATANHCPTPVLSEAALAAMARYDFPGNVRELENILERAMALSEGRGISLEELNLVPRSRDVGSESQSGAGLQEFLDATEKKAIMEALAKTGHNKTAAARLLGVTFRSLRYRIERLGMD
jgi:two-component system response regulator PilR (NtrC family)